MRGRPALTIVAAVTCDPGADTNREFEVASLACDATERELPQREKEGTKPSFLQCDRGNSPIQRRGQA